MFSRRRGCRYAAVISMALCGLISLPTEATTALTQRPQKSGSVTPLLRKAQAYEKSGNLPAAAAALREAERAAPSNATVHKRLATIYARSGYLDRQIEELAAAARLNPSDSDSALRIAEIYLRLAWFDRARPLIFQAIRVNPDDPRIFSDLATQAYMRFQYPAMEQAAREGLKRHPDNTQLLVLLAEADRLQGRMNEAEGLLGRVIRLAPDARRREAAYVGMAHLLLDTRWHPPRFKDAEQAARAALKIRPEDTDAHYWLGRALELTGKWQQAIPQYEVTYRKDPRFERVSEYLGSLYLRSHDPARRARGSRLRRQYGAIFDQEQRFAAARDAVMRNPADSNAHRDMGRAYLNTGQLPDAVVELREALRLNPRDQQARDLLVSALKSMGRLTEAKQAAR